MDNPLALFADWNDALTATVHALGGFKKVSVALRPELQTRPEAASQWLRDCLNPDKRDRLNPDQVLHLLREGRGVGFHAAKHWLDTELGYEQGAPVSERDEMAQLIHRGELMAAEMKHIAERMERLTRAPLKMVLNGGSSASNAA